MSEWYQIDSSALILQVTSKGAEMKRLFSREWNRELLWLGDEKVWNRSAPVLFPIVGKLKDGQYTFKGKMYSMPPHGFARDMEFKCVHSNSSEVDFVLVATQETFNVYPFLFEFRIRYKLVGTKLTVSYFVKNEDRQDIFFSIGAHPAFETKNISHYQIHFERAEKEYFRIENSLLNWNQAFELNSDKIILDKNIFKDDALIFKKLKSKYIDLIDTKRSEVIRIHSNPSHWGIWGKEEVPFVCIEPWFGVSDSADHDKNLENKDGIITLPEGEIFGFSYTIEVKNLQEASSPEKKNK